MEPDEWNPTGPESVAYGIGFWASQVQGIQLISELKKLHSTYGNYCTYCKMIDCPTLQVVAKYDLHAPDPDRHTVWNAHD